MRQPQRRFNPLILDVMKNEIYIVPEDKNKTTFICPFDTFTCRKMFLDLRIKSEGTDKNFKVNGHRLKLLHESPTLEEDTVKEISLRKVVYAVIYQP